MNSPVVLSAVEAQRERKRVREIIPGGGSEAIGRVGHVETVARRGEQDKNGLRACKRSVRGNQGERYKSSRGRR